MARLRKIANNFGPGALRALGARGYLRYLATTAAVLPAVARAGNLRPVDKAMRGVIALRNTVDRNTVRIDLDAYRPGDEAEDTYAFGLVREIWIRDVYLSHFALPARLGCVVDLGANRGIFSLQAAAICARVVAVEPVQAYAAPLSRNLELNGFNHVTIVKAMVGGDALLEAGAVPKLGLDDIMRMADGIPVDLVKVDIEGSEFGLDLALLRPAARLAMEIHPGWGEPASLVARVRALGFDCRTFDDALRRVPAGRADFLLAVNRSCPGAEWRQADTGESPE